MISVTDGLDLQATGITHLHQQQKENKNNTNEEPREKRGRGEFYLIYTHEHEREQRTLTLRGPPPMGRSTLAAQQGTAHPRGKKEMKMWKRGENEREMGWRGKLKKKNEGNRKKKRVEAITINEQMMMMH